LKFGAWLAQRTEAALASASLTWERFSFIIRKSYLVYLRGTPRRLLPYRPAAHPACVSQES